MGIPSPFQGDLRGIPLRMRILLKKPHPNLFPKPYMAQKRLSSSTKISIAAKAHHDAYTMHIQKNIYFIFDSSDLFSA